MNKDERYRLFQIRCRAKKGEHLSKEEQKYCEAMYKKYPRIYASMSKDVFEETKPFGTKP